MGLNGNPFTTRVPVQFISDDLPGLSITTTQNVLANNPTGIKVLAGNNAKLDQDILGIGHFRGDGESSPFALQLEWKALGFNDYLNLAALRPYLVTFITFRNAGYYGRLLMDGPESVPGTADIVHATGTFYPISPSDDGGAMSVSRISDPTSLAAAGDGGAGSGGIPTASDQYYYLTFSSEYGETNPQGPVHYHNTASLVAVNLTWTWPSSVHLQYASIYNAADNSGTNPRKVADIPSGNSATWTDYVGYGGITVNKALPTASRAFKGKWMSGVWINET